MKKHVVIVSKEYPTKDNPVYAFVGQLAGSLADQGVRVTVVAPQSVTRACIRRGARYPARSVDSTPGGNAVTVLRPYHISLSNRKRFGVDLPRLGLASFTRAVGRALSAMSDKPDALYGHFIFPAGLAVARLAQKLGVPGFLGFGESETARFSAFSDAYIAGVLRNLRGVVSVSESNKRILLERGLYTNPDRIGVFPNGADEALFHPSDRDAARKALGIDKDAFVVAFVGYFNARKGVSRLAEAIRRAGGIQSIFIGSGPETPDCPGIRFCGTVPHEKLSAYLAAADAFALPTRNEGCCNAIVEALATGLPVVSADRPFNDGLLDETNSIRIDPDDVDALTDALIRLRDDRAFRARLAEGASMRGARLSLSARARAIRDFFEVNC